MGSLNTLAGTRLYLDANIFIYAVEALSPFSGKLAALFGRLDRGELHAVTSELTLAEVLVKPLRDGNLVAVDAYDRMVRSSASLSVMSVSRLVLSRAATLRAKSKLKLPDAIHAATSVAEGCTTFLTNDRLFTAVPGLPVLLLPDLT